MYASRRPMNQRELVTVEVQEYMDARSAQRELSRVLSRTHAPEWKGGFLITPSSDCAKHAQSASYVHTNVVFSPEEYRE